MPPTCDTACRSAVVPLLRVVHPSAPRTSTVPPSPTATAWVSPSYSATPRSVAVVGLASRTSFSTTDESSQREHPGAASTPETATAAPQLAVSRRIESDRARWNDEVFMVQRVSKPCAIPKDRGSSPIQPPGPRAMAALPRPATVMPGPDRERLTRRTGHHAFSGRPAPAPPPRGSIARARHPRLQTARGRPRRPARPHRPPRRSR